MNVGYIYCYKNVLSNKVYIGQTYDINRRITEHKSKALRGYKEKFYNAIRKYGFNNFEFSVLYTFQSKSLERLTILLDSMESFLIRKFDSYYNGYNSTLGGHSKRGYSLPESFKEKCRNRRHTQETKQRMSISAKGRKPPTDTLLKMRESAKGNSRRNKAVLLFINGVPVKEFSSVKEAALYNNISTSQMSRLCSGKRNSTTDQIWRYK